MSERIYPLMNNYNDGASMSHISRYLLARGFISNGERVADVACGNGYGTSLLAQRVYYVYAFDKDDVFDPQYKTYKTEFKQCKIEDLPDCPVDTVVSLETIEHLADPKVLLNWVDKNAKRKFIVSSPNIPSTDQNAHHLSNVEFKTLQKLMENYPDWILYQVFYQDVYYIAVFVRKDAKLI